MQFADVSPEALEKIKSYRFDRFIEKHEGPERWDWFLKFYDLEFLDVEGYPVLLPVPREHHPNITILRCIVGDGGRSLTIFLKDTTYVDRPEDELFWAGRLAVCDKVPGEAFYIAIVYHEWFMVDFPAEG